jgi:hypothetical protein
MVPLLFMTLACSAFTQLASSLTHISTDPTVLLAPTPQAGSPAACTALYPDILKSATTHGTAASMSKLFGDDHEVHYLVVYAIHGNDLGKRENLLLPDAVDEKLNSTASHAAIWHYFTSLVPAPDRSYVGEFSILSDGSNNILAGVSPTYDNPREWTLKVDIVDASDPYSLTYSLLHEYGHLLTLNASQVPPDDQVFYHPQDSSLRDQAVASCPRYFTGEGCSNSGSYINEFFNRYWSSFYAEWQAANQGQDSQQRDLLNKFYYVHEDEFLTAYAATSPEEDIAESWTYFLLSPKPEPTSIANKKILFFYDYPELVTLREEILNNLCSSFPHG